MEIEKFIVEQARQYGGLWSILFVISWYSIKGLALLVSWFIKRLSQSTDQRYQDTKDRLDEMEKLWKECESKHESTRKESAELAKETNERINKLTEEMATYRGQVEALKANSSVKTTVDKLASATLLRSMKDDPGTLKTLVREIDDDTRV